MTAYVIAPAGLSAAGTWFPGVLVDPSRPPVILADDIDELTGEVRSLFVGVHPVDAAIREAFRLSNGTGPAVMACGQKFRQMRKINATTPRQILDEANRVAAPFVARGDVELGALSEVQGDTGVAFVEYTNLRSSSPGQRVKVGS